MMEKRNKVIEKAAAGDSRDLDDIVEMGARRLARSNVPKAGGRGLDRLGHCDHVQEAGR